MPLNRFTRGTYVQNLSQIGPGVWSVGGVLSILPLHTLYYGHFCILQVMSFLLVSVNVKHPVARCSIIFLLQIWLVSGKTGIELLMPEPNDAVEISFAFGAAIASAGLLRDQAVI